MDGNSRIVKVVPQLVLRRFSYLAVSELYMPPEFSMVGVFSDAMGQPAIAIPCSLVEGPTLQHSENCPSHSVCPDYPGGELC